METNRRCSPCGSEMLVVSGFCWRLAVRDSPHSGGFNAISQSETVTEHEMKDLCSFLLGDLMVFKFVTNTFKKKKQHHKILLFPESILEILFFPEEKHNISSGLFCV